MFNNSHQTPLLPPIGPITNGANPPRAPTSLSNFNSNPTTNTITSTHIPPPAMPPIQTHSQTPTMLPHTHIPSTRPPNALPSLTTSTQASTTTSPSIPSNADGTTTTTTIQQPDSKTSASPLQYPGVQQMAASPDRGQGSPSRPLPSPLDTMRAYRACLNCRNRKSKCDLDVNQGRPPCRRCQREARECILGESHRGGRRVRKKPKLENSTASSTTPNPGFSPSIPQLSPPMNHSSQLPCFDTRYDQQQKQGGQGYTWQHPTSDQNSISENGGILRRDERSNIIIPPIDNPYGRSKSSLPTKPPYPEAVHENITSADLQNPSDALEILAQVADRAEDGDSIGSEQTHGQGHDPTNHPRPVSRRQGPSPPTQNGLLYYKPVQDGQLSAEMVYHLFSVYEEHFHPFFPIAPKASFDRTRMSWMSRHEPHLFAAILTVASKDNERVHHTCYDHMQQLVSMILAGSDADIEAVEALLLLSQWVSHRPQAATSVGRGEEDRVAWMYIGTALRLGYFLGIDRTSFKPDSRDDPVIFNRKKLVWMACFMSDRHISVRVGKGFWSRGPGPLSAMKGSDFPTLAPQSQEGDDWGLIFQANLEITQIFSNVHDILYSSKGHGWKEMLEGRYAKYLDDFRSSIRSWNDVWGTLICSPRLKASLMLTYDYLRVYVNAFAYQAAISRALTFQRDSENNPNRSSMPLINATATDARFIYEALDAAKSLLSTFNNFVEPETLRYMPSSYYLFIIYSAVFLYKARSTTTMTDEERTGVRRMINQTIERLQKASVGANHMGSRYARLLQLLWRKAPKPNAIPTHQRPTSISERLNAQNPTSTPTSNSPISSYHPQQHLQQNINFDPNNQFHAMGMGMGMNPSNNGSSNGTFSWLDLGATWNFATQNNSVSGGSAGELDDVMMDKGMSPYNMGLLTDYSLLEGDNPNLIF